MLLLNYGIIGTHLSGHKYFGQITFRTFLGLYCRNNKSSNIFWTTLNVVNIINNKHLFHHRGHVSATFRQFFVCWFKQILEFCKLWESKNCRQIFFHFDKSFFTVWKTTIIIVLQIWPNFAFSTKFTKTFTLFRTLLFFNADKKIFKLYIIEKKINFAKILEILLFVEKNPKIISFLSRIA